MKSIRIVAMTSVLGLTLSAASAYAQEDTWSTDLSKRTVPMEEIVPGGPPKDGIPAIDHPKFEHVQRADRWLEDREPVAVVELNGEPKAYPLQILVWHEIVNDVVGGIPVAVTYCPLCNTTLAFDRRFDGRVLDFGTTGFLRHSDLVMYDRQTETWWQQATGEGLVGDFAGEELRFIGSPVVSWAAFKQQYPEGQVLSRDTGHPEYADDYGRTPYVGYDAPDSSPWSIFGGKSDDRLTAKDRVVAVELGGETRAYPFSRLREIRVKNDRIRDRKIVVLWAPGTASAVDSASIASGRDIGATGVFDRTVGNRTLNFEPKGEDLFRDKQTGTTWNLLGYAISGPLAGQRLVPIQHGNHFWFAWAAFQPDTKVIR